MAVNVSAPPDGLQLVQVAKLLQTDVRSEITFRQESVSSAHTNAHHASALRTLTVPHATLILIGHYYLMPNTETADVMKDSSKWKENACLVIQNVRYATG
jgi:hypothetical protein